MGPRPPPTACRPPPVPSCSQPRALRPPPIAASPPHPLTRSSISGHLCRLRPPTGGMEPPIPGFSRPCADSYQLHTRCVTSRRPPVQHPIVGESAEPVSTRAGDSNPTSSGPRSLKNSDPNILASPPLPSPPTSKSRPPPPSRISAACPRSLPPRPHHSRAPSVDGGQKMLVYNYLENKTVAKTLFGTSCGSIWFDWRTRVKICTGVDDGLAYLHEEVRPHIVHRDIMASNVLLVKDLNPKISDFGLAKLFLGNMTHISSRVTGILGYLALEYAIRGQLTKKADVYSFGVLLLEIFSGRWHTDPRLPLQDQFLLETGFNVCCHPSDESYYGLSNIDSHEQSSESTDEENTKPLGEKLEDALFSNSLYSRTVLHHAMKNKGSRCTYLQTSVLPRDMRSGKEIMCKWIC